MNNVSEIGKKMLASDAFSQWLDLQITSCEGGKCVLTIRINKQMTNGFNVSHGGIVFSLADSAAAFAANSYGTIAVSVDNSIHYAKPVYDGDTLTAIASEQTRNKKTGHYEVIIRNQNQEIVAVFHSTLYFTGKPHE